LSFACEMWVSFFIMTCSISYLQYNSV
jgi:hypothetical protein